jgi:hypothetical protein
MLYPSSCWTLGGYFLSPLDPFSYSDRLFSGPKKERGVNPITKSTCMPSVNWIGSLGNVDDGLGRTIPPDSHDSHGESHSGESSPDYVALG